MRRILNVGALIALERDDHALWQRLKLAPKLTRACVWERN